MFKGLVAHHDYKYIEAILQPDNHTILFKSPSVGHFKRAKVLHDPHYHNSKKFLSFLMKTRRVPETSWKLQLIKIPWLEDGSILRFFMPNVLDNSILTGGPLEVIKKEPKPMTKQ
jgi:hypothetical protein